MGLLPIWRPCIWPPKETPQTPWPLKGSLFTWLAAMEQNGFTDCKSLQARSPATSRNGVKRRGSSKVAASEPDGINGSWRR